MLELKAVIVPLGRVVFWDTQVISVLGDHSGGTVTHSEGAGSGVLAGLHWGMGAPSGWGCQGEWR